jgi:hypothetical protein
MEDHKGEISVQLYSEPERVAEAFKELKGKPHDKSSRATYLQLWYEDGKVRVQSEVRDLPVPVEESPDGYRLGEGPITFPKGEGENECQHEKSD